MLYEFQMSVCPFMMFCNREQIHRFYNMLSANKNYRYAKIRASHVDKPILYEIAEIFNRFLGKSTLNSLAIRCKLMINFVAISIFVAIISAISVRISNRFISGNIVSESAINQPKNRCNFSYHFAMWDTIKFSA